MNESRELFKVQPLGRYTAPRYPSHEDPDPTRHPYPVPFPLSRALVSTIAGVGLALSSQHIGSDDKLLDIKPSTAANPFALTFSGLPHRTSPYGTGQPRYVQDKLAREVIERVFREHGIRLDKDYRYKKNGLEFVADGFDSKRRIGYVFGTWRNLDHDAVISWMNRGLQSNDVNTLKRQLQYLKRQAPARLQPDVARALEIDDLESLKKAYQKIAASIKEGLLSLEEAKVLEKRAEEGKEFIALISQYDLRFATQFSLPRLSELQQKKLDAIKQIRDKKKMAAAYQQFYQDLARQGLEQLETQVRKYISWARRQGY